MYVTRSGHVAQNVILELGHRLQGICHILVLLNVTNYLCCLGPLGEIDEVRLLNNRWDTVLNECEVG